MTKPHGAVTKIHHLGARRRSSRLCSTALRLAEEALASLTSFGLRRLSKSSAVRNLGLHCCSTASRHLVRLPRLRLICNAAQPLPCANASRQHSRQRYLISAAHQKLAKCRDGAAAKADARRRYSCCRRRRRHRRQASRNGPRHVAAVLRRRGREGCRVRQRGRAAAAVPVARPAAGAGRRRRPSPQAHAVRGRPQRSRGAQPNFLMASVLPSQDAQAAVWQSKGRL